MGARMPDVGPELADVEFQRCLDGQRAACRAHDLEWLGYTRIRIYETMREK